MNENQLQALLGQIGLHLDSDDTGAILRNLEAVKSRTYDVQYPALKGRQLIPVSHEVDPGAERIVYYQWDHTGVAEIISNYADDLSLVDAHKKEFTNKVYSLGKAYQYSIQDLRRAALSGNSLDAHRAMAVRMAFEQKVDSIAATGEADMPGLLNHPNVPLVSLPTGTWSGATSAQILADLNFFVQSIVNATKGVHAPNTLVLDTASFGIISQMPMSTDNTKTVLKTFLENSPYITDIDQWVKCDTANAAGNGPRICAFQRDPMVLELEIPLELEQLPPQPRGLAFIVNCHGRIGGVIMRYPFAAAYTDDM